MPMCKLLELSLRITIRGSETTSGQNIVFHVGFTVNTNSGAILVMHKPRMIYIPDAFFMASSSKDISILKGKVVVHQTWECPGFSMYYFSGKREYHTPVPFLLRRIIALSTRAPEIHSHLAREY